MSQYDKQHALASRLGGEAFCRGEDAGRNPYLTRDPSVMAEMWHSGWARAAGVSPLTPNPDRVAAKQALVEKWDALNALVAAAFPERWARAQTYPGPKRRERQRRLRSEYQALHAA